MKFKEVKSVPIKDLVKDSEFPLRLEPYSKHNVLREELNMVLKEYKKYRQA